MKFKSGNLVNVAHPHYMKKIDECVILNDKIVFNGRIRTVFMDSETWFLIIDSIIDPNYPDTWNDFVLLLDPVTSEKFWVTTHYMKKRV
jgi:hypothetical protein